MCLTLATVVLHSTFNTWNLLLRFSYCALKTFTFSPEPVHHKNHRYHQILTVKDRKKISCVYTNHYKAVLLILSHIFRYLKHLESAKILLLVTTFTLQKELWWGHWSRIRRCLSCYRQQLSQPQGGTACCKNNKHTSEVAGWIQSMMFKQILLDIIADIIS